MILQEHTKDFDSYIETMNNIKMAIHPDDPPFPIFGLPRVASNLDDFDHIFKNVPYINNGLTFCTGSLASIFKNDLTNIFEKFSDIPA